MPRPLYVIANDIRNDWKKVNYAAKPYLDALAVLDGPDDTYGADSAAYIIRYFLANAQSWRGEAARRIKLELKSLV